MCFSPEASFTASFALFAIGILTISRIHSPRHLMIAMIPLLFSLQQACEGMLWLILDQPNLWLWQTIFKYGFLTFAFLVWPIWLPSSLFLVETNSTRRLLLGLCASLGIIWAVYMLYVFIQTGAYVALGCYHIYYSINIPLITTGMGLVLYNLATILPLFIASVPKMWIFGIFAFLSCILSLVMWTQFFISIWCFFAALISLLVYATVQYLPASKQPYRV